MHDTQPQPPPASARDVRLSRRQRLRAWLRQLTTLQIALGVSIGVHAGLLGVRFVDPEGFDRVFRDTPLEVILVNARSSEPPAKAQAIAQAALAGGGEAQAGRATSPLPPSAFTEVGDAMESTRKQVEQLQEQQQQLLAQVRRELARLPPPDPKRDEGSTEAQSRQEQQRQLLQMLAEIEKRINEENSRPRKRYVSPSTEEAPYAIYYDRLKRRIEEKGTQNFPEERGRKLYGELVMVIWVDSRGRVIDTEIVQSSGQNALDKRAQAIARGAGPFGPFSDTMRQQTDVIAVASRFKFSRDEGMSAKLFDGQ